MEDSVSKLREFTCKKFSRNFGLKSENNRSDVMGGDSDFESNGSKFFSGSSVTQDLVSKPFLSYHRDSFKGNFTSKQKSTLMSNVVGQESLNDDISWDNISFDDKSEVQCLMKYRNSCDPQISRESWTQSEEKTLVVVANQHRGVDWCSIADTVSRVECKRTPIQCLQHYQRSLNRSLMRPTEWSAEEERVLLEAVSLYGINRSWQHVANCLDGRASNQCYERWKRINSRGMKCGSWGDDEERKLVGAVYAYEKNRKNLDPHSVRDGTMWQRISRFVPQRNEAKCREKWSNVLDPNSVDISQFAATEDSIILKEAQKFLENGHVVKWSSVAGLLKGRTDAQCMRRWKELSGTAQAKAYLDASKKRRAIAVPRHSRNKASKNCLQHNDFSPVLYTTSS